MGKVCFRRNVLGDPLTKEGCAVEADVQELLHQHVRVQSEDICFQVSCAVTTFNFCPLYLSPHDIHDRFETAWNIFGW